ncbi:MAG: hypothetical protein OJF50_004074 [Nitrospira sp.]|nr:hypothetical protein [Nitrospira sp.]
MHNAGVTDSCLSVWHRSSRHILWPFSSCAHGASTFTVYLLRYGEATELAA